MSENTSVQTDSYPRIDIRRQSDGVYDEDWRIVLANGQPTEIHVRSVRTKPLHRKGGAVVKGEWEEVQPSRVPPGVIAEVEEHMVPRGSFGTTHGSQEDGSNTPPDDAELLCHNCGEVLKYHTVGHYYQCANCKRTVLAQELETGESGEDDD